jgi:L-ribulokinase
MSTADTNDDERYVVGIDYGTLSGRAVVVRVSDGAELGSGVLEYPHAVMDRTLVASGAALPPEWALQVPSDYVDVIKHAVPAALAEAGIDPSKVIGVGTDFTACTMVPTLADGTPLNELPEYADRPHAYVKLWKHHAAQGQADRINRLAEERGEAWLPRYGGLISSEWEFAKGLQLLEEDPELYNRMEHWVEAADWIVWQLTGEYVRNACTAGYKGILQDGEYPSSEFLGALNPDFADFATSKVEHRIGQLGDAAGRLSAEAAAWTGLPEGIAVAMNSDVLTEVPGMCGVVDGGIVSGLYGYEAGQSGVGDIFAWYVENQVPARYRDAASERGISIHQYLTELSENQPVGGHGLLALDWNNGNRSVLVDTELSGLLVGQTLATRTEEIYRALLESTAFGTRKIIETFNASGVPVTEFIAAGGLIKNAFLMQTYSDILRMPISVLASSQGPALGSAIHAAVAAGAYPDVLVASESMGRLDEAVYVPNEANADAYDALYADYSELHDYFGRGANDVMKRLKTARKKALA